MFNERLSLRSGPQAHESLWLQAEATRKVRQQFLASAIEVGEELGSPEQALAAINLLSQLDDLTASTLVQHPSFRYWLQSARRTTSGQFKSFRPSVVASFPSILWAMGCVSGQIDIPWRIVADKGGGIRVLPFGSYIELGEERAGQLVVISSRPSRLCLNTEGGDAIGEIAWTMDNEGYLHLLSVTSGIRIREFERLFQGEITIDSRDPWLRVRLTGTNQRRDGTDFFGADDELYDENRSAPHIRRAADEILDIWPEAAEDIGIFTQAVVPIWLPETQRGAFTVSSRQGAIFIGEGETSDVVDMILHENAHVKLRQIQLLDTLLVDPLDETEKISVPWRPDLRPVPGVLEGLFVFSHVAEFNLRRPQRNYDLDARVIRLARDLRAANSTVADVARFTPEGELFFAEIGEWIGSIAERCPATSLVA